RGATSVPQTAARRRGRGWLRAARNRRAGDGGCAPCSAPRTLPAYGSPRAGATAKGPQQQAVEIRCKPCATAVSLAKRGTGRRREHYRRPGSRAGRGREGEDVAELRQWCGLLTLEARRCGTE